jgi:hypothetical protein
MAGTFLIMFPLLAALVGAAYALAWFFGRWAGLALSVVGLAGTFVLYRVTKSSFDWTAPAWANGAGVYAVTAFGMVFVIADASGPALFGRHQLASVTSLCAGMLAVMCWPFIAAAIGLYFGPPVI